MGKQNRIFSRIKRMDFKLEENENVYKMWHVNRNIIVINEITDLTKIN